MSVFIAGELSLPLSMKSCRSTRRRCRCRCSAPPQRSDDDHGFLLQEQEFSAIQSVTASGCVERLLPRRLPTVNGTTTLLSSHDYDNVAFGNWTADFFMRLISLRNLLWQTWEAENAGPENGVA